MKKKTTKPISLSHTCFSLYMDVCAGTFIDIYPCVSVCVCMCAFVCQSIFAYVFTPNSVNYTNGNVRYHTKKAGSRRYQTETRTDADDANDLALLANTPVQAKSLRIAKSNGLYINANKKGFIYFKQA